METKITFEVNENILEGLYNKVDGGRGVVITHPHSLYGGDMHNPVVQALAEVYTSKGFSTLRFNFRGVGASGGVFAEAIGECDDLLGAIGFIRDTGVDAIHLAGYSFGARVIAGLNTLPQCVCSSLLVAPPVAFMDFSGISDIDRLDTVIVGENDEIAPVDQIQQLLESWNPAARLFVLKDTDHFFSNSIELLKQTVAKEIAQAHL